MSKKNWFVLTKPSLILSAMIASGLLTGCAVVPSTPNTSLTDFSTSIEELRTDTEKSFSEITVASEARFKDKLIKELSDGDTDSLDSLDIKTDFKTLSVDKVPDFLHLEQLKAGVSELNISLVAYANLLTNLADPNAISADTFDTLAHSLNRNVLEAAPSIKSETGKDDTGLFSVAAMSITKHYLQSKQSGLLVKAIRSNQATIKRFAAHLQKAVRTIAISAEVEYSNDMKVLKRKLVETKDRSKLVDQLMIRDKKHFEDLQTLKRLHTNYGRLPLIHAAAADVILAGNGRLPRMIRLLEASSKFKTQYETISTPSAPVNAPVPTENPATPTS